MTRDANGFGPDGTYTVYVSGYSGPRTMGQPKYRFGQRVVVRLPNGSECHTVECVRRLDDTYVYEWRDVSVGGVLTDRKALESEVYGSSEELDEQIKREELNKKILNEGLDAMRDLQK